MISVAKKISCRKMAGFHDLVNSAQGKAKFKRKRLTEIEQIREQEKSIQAKQFYL